MSNVVAETEAYDRVRKLYSDVIGLDKFLERAKTLNRKWVVEAIENFYYTNSNMHRHQNAALLKILGFPRKTEYTVCYFKAHRSVNADFHNSYAILYSYIEKDINHEFICIAPTYQSADGEYRTRFVPFQQILTWRDRNQKILAFIKAKIGGDLKKNVDLYTAIFFPTEMEAPIIDRYKAELETMNLPEMLFCISWFLEASLHHKNMEANHLNDNLTYVMFNNNMESDISALQKEFPEYNADNNLLQTLHQGVDQVSRLHCGQKYVMLSVHEVEFMNNMQLTPWREIAMNRQTSNLVLNGITPCLPVFNDWFLIQHQSPEMFDNKVSHMKLGYSELTKRIVRDLEASKSNTYYVKPDGTQEYVTIKMFGLGNRIEIPIEYAEAEIIKSDYTLVNLYEHIGRTLYDVPRLLEAESYRKVIGNVFGDHRLFSKMLFEIIYTLACLNSKIDVIHGDLHLNNAVMFTGNPSETIHKIIRTNNHCVYHSNGRDYMFPTHCSYVGLIDFSRGFIWSKKFLKQYYNRIEQASIKNSFKTRLIELISRDMPEFFARNRALVELAVAQQFRNVYNICKVLDTQRISTLLIAHIQKEILDKPNRMIFCDLTSIMTIMLPKLRSIKHDCIEMFTTHMKRVFDDLKTSFNDPFLNQSLIDAHFSEYRLENQPNPTAPIYFTDYHSDDNEVLYTLDAFENYPPTMKFVVSQSAELSKKLKDINAYQSKHNPSEQIETISQIELEGKSARRGTNPPGDPPSVVPQLSNKSVVY